MHRAVRLEVTVVHEYQRWDRQIHAQVQSSGGGGSLRIKNNEELKQWRNQSQELENNQRIPHYRSIQWAVVAVTPS